MTKNELLGLIKNYRGDKKTLKELNPILEGIVLLAASGGNVQPDWDQTDSDEDDFIKHKPIVPAIEQTTGAAEDKVMSQKAVTDIIGDVETLLAAI